MQNFSCLPQSKVTQKRHPKTHCLKHPPIKPTPKQPPNQHPKPPKHLVTTGEQSPPSMTTTSEMETQKWKIFKLPLLSQSSYRCCCRPLLLSSLQPSSFWTKRDKAEIWEWEWDQIWLESEAFRWTNGLIGFRDFIYSLPKAAFLNHVYRQS